MSEKNAASMPVVVSNAEQENLAAFLLRMRRQGLDNKALFAAIEAAPRRKFVDPQFHHVAFGPRTIPIGCGQTMESLDLQAHVIDRLGLNGSQRVLEIGTGSGFTACVMGHMAKRVDTMDRYATLQRAAAERVRALGLGNVIATQADGSAGRDDGPFDRIVCWAAFAEFPKHFIDQLVSGGVIVCAVGPAGQPQELIRLTKVGSRFEREDIGTARFLPLEKGLPKTL